MSADLADTQARLRRFGEVECRDSAPLYARLAIIAAEDQDIAGLLLAAPSAQRRGTTFFAAVHFSLLRDPDHPLAAVYPSTGGDPTNPDAEEAFRLLCRERAQELRALLAVKATQTNEVRRCAALVPALATIADGSPLTLVEIGASAGLNLLLDRYRYDYAGTVVGPAHSPVFIEPRVVGKVRPPVPADMPVIAHRVGIDLAPVDLGDADARLWLRACVWAEHEDRARTLAAALKLAAAEPPTVVAGDALDALPDLVARADAASTVCVISSNVLPYLTPEEREALFEQLDRLGAPRPMHWVSAEGTDFRFPWAAAAPQPPFTPFAMAITLGRFHEGRRGGRVVGYAGPHGEWLQWVDAAPP